MPIVLLLLVVAIIFIVRRFLGKGKRLTPLGTITVCTGAVKTGKTTLAVWLAVKSYYKVLFRWWVATKIFKKDIEKPLLYSNIPLRIRFVPLTTDILLLKQRQAYGSVTLIDEASLVADSQLIRDKQVNNSLLLYFKLYGHRTHGGTCVIDSQCIQDVQFNIKRSINSYTYIARSQSLPFFIKQSVIEQRYSEDGTIITTENEDIDNKLKRIFIPKFVWKLFDTYCFSALTDNLDVANVSVKVKNLKTEYICSFRPEFADLKNTIKGGSTDAEA